MNLKEINLSPAGTDSVAFHFMLKILNKNNNYCQFLIKQMCVTESTFTFFFFKFFCHCNHEVFKKVCSFLFLKKKIKK